MRIWRSARGLWLLIHTDDCDAYGTDRGVVHEIYKIEGDGKVNITIGKQQLKRGTGDSASSVQ